MKKKVFLSLLCGVMVLGLATGCGNKTSDNSNNDSSTNNNMQNGCTNKNYEIDADLKGTVAVNITTTQYCFSSPDTLVKRANTGHKFEVFGYSIIYDQYIDASQIEYGIDYTSIKNSSDVMDVMKKQFIETAKNGLIYADDYDYEITSKENKKINGYNMTKFKGTFTLKSEWPLDYNKTDFVGYSLLKNGYPIYFAVIDKPNGENRINIEEMADKIVKSFRENDGDCYDD